MLKSCVQILLTYLRRPYTWLAILPVVVIYTFLLAQIFHQPVPAQRVATVLAVIVAFVLSYVLSIVLQLRRHIGCPQSSLLPHYRARHILVAAALLLCPVVAGSLLASAALHVPYLPTLGLTLVIAAATAWTIYLLPPRHLGIAFILVFLCTQYAPISAFVPHFIAGATPLEAAPFLIVGTLASIAFGWYLFTTRDQLPDGASAMTMRPWETRLYSSGPRDGVRPYRPNALSLALSPGDAAFARLRKQPVRSLWQRLRRRQLGLGHRSAMIAGFLVIALQLLLFRGEMAIKVGFDCALLLLMPTILNLSTVLILRPTLAQESLRPIARSKFFIELAAYLGLRALEVWLAMLIALVASVAIMQPALLAEPTFWLKVGASLVLQGPILAASFWLARYRASATAGLWIIAFLFSTLLNASLPPAFMANPITLALIAACLLVITFLIAADGYRRWLHTNLG